MIVSSVFETHLLKINIWANWKAAENILFEIGNSSIKKI